MKSPFLLTTSGATTCMWPTKNFWRNTIRAEYLISLLNAYGLSFIALAMFHTSSDIQNGEAYDLQEYIDNRNGGLSVGLHSITFTTGLESFWWTSIFGRWRASLALTWLYGPVGGLLRLCKEVICHHSGAGAEGWWHNVWWLKTDGIFGVCSLPKTPPAAYVWDKAVCCAPVQKVEYDAASNAAISCVAKSGDTMTSDLTMDGALVRALQMTYPPEDCAGLRSRWSHPMQRIHVTQTVEKWWPVTWWWMVPNGLSLRSLCAGLSHLLDPGTASCIWSCRGCCGYMGLQGQWHNVPWLIHEWYPSAWTPNSLFLSSLCKGCGGLLDQGAASRNLCSRGCCGHMCRRKQWHNVWWLNHE